jgi:predicted MFS family arabinose efflux permease
MRTGTNDRREVRHEGAKGLGDPAVVMKFLLLKFSVSLPILLATSLTLSLLVFVGFWETGKQYAEFQVSKLAAEVEIVQHALTPYLQSGLPLAQYSGFTQLSESIIKTDASIEYISVSGVDDALLFINRPQFTAQAAEPPLSTGQDALPYQRRQVDADLAKYGIEESTAGYRLSLPLYSKFGRAGTLHIGANKKTIQAMLDQGYGRVFHTLGWLLGLFALLALVIQALVHATGLRRLLFKSLYIISFIGMSGMVVQVVYQIYEQGAQSKAVALADSMAARLNSALDLGISLQDLSDINQVLAEYKAHQPDIQTISVVNNGQIAYSSRPTLIGSAYQVSDDTFAYPVKLHALRGQDNALYLAVALPRAIVRNAILASVNEFLTLIIACGLISLIFIDASTGIAGIIEQRIAKRQRPNPLTEHGLHDRLALDIIKPGYFIIVFVHALSVSFLPQMVTGLLEGNASRFASLSLPFTLYYVAFALVLIPAGNHAERGSLKHIMMLGCLLELFGLLILIFWPSYWPVVVGRTISGAGQGLFLIGLQSYLLAVTPEERRTQGTAVKVISRNAGLIAGSAIGALVYAFTDFRTVFMLGSALSILGMLYLGLLVADAHEPSPPAPGNDRAATRRVLSIFHNLQLALQDAEFVKTLLFIALPGKMAITGVIMFAVPLVLTGMQFAPGEIGQALMLYYISSIIATYYASRLVDRYNMSHTALVLSALIGGISILLLGIAGIGSGSSALDLPWAGFLLEPAHGFNQWLDNFQTPWLSTTVMMGSLMLAGLSNGLLTSPTVTHINKTPVARQQGIKSITATYAFLERLGHLLGPLVVGILFAITLQSSLALVLFSFVVLLLGMLFLFGARKI